MGRIGYSTIDGVGARVSHRQVYEGISITRQRFIDLLSSTSLLIAPLYCLNDHELQYIDHAYSAVVPREDPSC